MPATFPASPGLLMPGGTNTAPGTGGMGRRVRQRDGVPRDGDRPGGVRSFCRAAVWLRGGVRGCPFDSVAVVHGGSCMSVGGVGSNAGPPRKDGAQASPPVV